MAIKRKSRSATIWLVITVLFTLPLLRAQSNQPASPRIALPPPPLKLFVLQGQGALNFIPDHRAVTPVVEVRDENDLPLEGVSVRFELPESGPGGRFADGQRTSVTRSNAQGQAAAPFIPNDQRGTFTILVEANTGTRSGHASIAQTNSLEHVRQAAVHHGHWYTNWKFITVVSAAAVAGIVLATRGGGNSKVTIIPGSPTLSAPQ